jgi:hypothetical protein
MKESWILLPMPRHESIVDTDINTTEVSSIKLMAISTFYVKNPE